MKIKKLAFYLTLTAAFIFGLNFTSLGLFSPTNNFLNPTAQLSPIDKIMEELIIPQLSLKKNSFIVRESRSFIPQAEATILNIDANALLALDLDTGEVLYEKNLEDNLPIASLTKIMTAVVALDLAKSDELFSVSDYASRQIPTRIGVVPEEKLKLKELLDAILLTSANDAASVIQEGIDKKYGASVFIKAMNEKAKFLGLTNTSFANPQGFDDRENYSTVKDLGVLTHYALKNYPEIAESVKKDYEFLPADTNHKQFDLYNWNGLIGVYPDTIGMKIGNTGSAGKTTMVVSNREGKKILAVVLGAPDIISRDKWAAELLDYGYQQTLGLSPVKVTEEMLREKYSTWEYF